MAEEEEVPVVVRVGYALSSKKRLSFLQPSLVRHARLRGVLLVPVDPSHPIAEQGPFDVILHKLPGEPWFASLAEFSSSNPAAIVVDPPDAIKRLHNRVSMLQAVSDVCLPASCKETFGVPKQVVYEAGSQVIQLSEQLKFPAIAKPLVADGSENSHAMSLIFNAESLAKLTPPVVLQEFVNHGGFIFKVYVVGEHVRCVRRKSLADIQDAELRNHVEPLFFSQISNAPRSDHSCVNADPDLQLVELPPSKFVSGIASGLRKALGLHLFNFDVIRDKTAESHYYIIDINYFPGFAKMPEYESVLTDFFLDLVSDKTQGIDN